MPQRLRKDDPRYEEVIDELRRDICNFIIRNPRLKEREVMAVFGQWFWLSDVRPALSELMDDGIIGTEQDGVWDVLVFGRAIT